MVASRAEVSKLLQSRDEKVIAILGQSYLGTLLAGGPMSRGIMILTDRYLYVKGRVATVGRGYKNIDNVVGVEDVLSCTIEEHSAGCAAWVLPTMGGAAALLGLFLWSRASSGAEEGLATAGSIMTLIGLIWFFAGLIAVVRGAGRGLSVQYAGGAVSVSARWYSQAEMEDFRRHLNRAKDNARSARRSPTGGVGATAAPSSAGAADSEPNAGATKTCPYCAETVKAAAIKCRFCGSDLSKPPG